MSIARMHRATGDSRLAPLACAECDDLWPCEFSLLRRAVDELRGLAQQWRAIETRHFACEAAAAASRMASKQVLDIIARADEEIVGPGRVRGLFCAQGQCGRWHVAARIRDADELKEFVGRMRKRGLLVSLQTSVPSWFEFCHDEECKESE